MNILRRSDYKGFDKICIQCGITYSDVAYRRVKFCSLKCYSNSTKQEYVCRFCKKVFRSRPTRNIFYCSRKCMGASTRGIKKPQWIKAKISKSKLGKPRPDMIGNTYTLGMKHTKEAKRKVSLFNKGKTLSMETRMKLREIHLGDKNPQWRGGVTPLYKQIRDSIEYEEWRTKVFTCDNYTCQDCGQVGGYLQADHIKPFAFYPEHRFEVSNGRTLCQGCHRKTDTYGSKVFSYMKRSIAL